MTYNTKTLQAKAFTSGREKERSLEERNEEVSVLSSFAGSNNIPLYPLEVILF